MALAGAFPISKAKIPALGNLAKNTLSRCRRDWATGLEDEPEV